MRSASAAERFIFTVSTGRCGDASLAHLLDLHVFDCYPAFETPHIHRLLPGALGRYEHSFRRRFIETHELLGRGKVLRAFDDGDDAFIDRIVTRRLRMIRREMARRRARVYFDVSKFFARGLHVGFRKAVGQFALVNLVRDPVQNMRSYLNRDKNFMLDNSAPDAANNILRLDLSSAAKGELYLWAWCEMNLRFEAMCQEAAVTEAVEIGTDDLNDRARMEAVFRKLGLAHRPFEPQPPLNTNVQNGFPATRVSAADIRIFERFRERVPNRLLDRITYLRSYDPWARNNLAASMSEVA
jgi:hypothetical protein